MSSLNSLCLPLSSSTPISRNVTGNGTSNDTFRVPATKKKRNMKGLQLTSEALEPEITGNGGKGLGSLGNEEDEMHLQDVDSEGLLKALAGRSAAGRARMNANAEIRDREASFTGAGSSGGSADGPVSGVMVGLNKLKILGGGGRKSTPKLDLGGAPSLSSSRPSSSNGTNGSKKRGGVVFEDEEGQQFVRSAKGAESGSSSAASSTSQSHIQAANTISFESSSSSTSFANQKAASIASTSSTLRSAGTITGPEAGTTASAGAGTTSTGSSTKPKKSSKSSSKTTSKSNKSSEGVVNSKMDLKNDGFKVVGDLGAGAGGTVMKVVHQGTGLTMARKVSEMFPSAVTRGRCPNPVRECAAN